MKHLFYIHDTQANKISYYLLLLFLICLPFDRFYSEVLLIGFVLHTLLHIRTRPFHALKNKGVWIIASVWLVSFIGLLYTDFLQEGLNDCAKQLAILIFPLAFSITRIDMANYKDKLLMAFAGTCVLVVLYLYLNALHIILYNQLSLKTLFSNTFINHRFSFPIEMHATYLSMYIFIAFFFILRQLLVTKERTWQLIYMGCLATLLAGLVQLGSKAVLISMLIGSNLVFPLFIRRPKFNIVSTTGTVLLLVMIFTVPVLRERYVTGFKEDLLPGQAETQDPRSARWVVAMDLLKQRPVAGYGTGAEIPVLEKAYYKDKLYFAYYYSFNTHNEYLSRTFATGCIGLLVFLYTLFYGMRAAFRKKDVLFGSFIVLIAIVCVSENILLVNKGIFFYSFFFSLFLLADSRQKLVCIGKATCSDINRINK